MIRYFIVPRILVLILGAVFFYVGPLWAKGSKEAPTDPPKETITIIDQTRREVSFVRPLKRVVTIPIPAASMFIALDGGVDRLVGMHPQSKSAIKEGILNKFFPKAMDVNSEVVGEGFMPNVETLMKLNPDIIFQWGHLGTGVVAPMERAGLNVVLLIYGTQEYLEGWIKIFGDSLEKKDRGEKLLAWHHNTRAEIEKKVSSVPISERPRVLYFLRWLSSKSVAGSGTYNDFYINMIGGVNPAASLKGFVEVNDEQILSWNPEVILLNGFEPSLTPKDLYGNKNLADVSAIKNRRVYKIPLGGYRWDPPNQESPLMWKWLSMVLQPKRFYWNLREEIVATYQWLYGSIPDTKDLDLILRMEENAGSAGYEIFK